MAALKSHSKSPFLKLQPDSGIEMCVLLYYYKELIDLKHPICLLLFVKMSHCHMVLLPTYLDGLPAADDHSSQY